MVWLKRCTSFALLFLLIPAFATDVFEVKTIQIGKIKLKVEVANTDSLRAQGLMFRETMKYDGMLFVYEYERELGFWMKNTLMDLSIGFFDGEGTLTEVLDMKVEPRMILDSKLKVYKSKKPARYALELEKGGFQKRKIMIGSRLQISSLK